MERLLGSEALSDEEIKLAIKYRQQNAKAAHESLNVLELDPEPTEMGQSILGTLRGYWAKRPVE
jgi:hypothetical protein